MPSGGTFAWGNGSRVYYANLVSPFVVSGGQPFPNEVFRGFIGIAVSRLDNPTPASILLKSSWKPPVMVNTRNSQTAFDDKEQIWADNASSSPFFGRVYVCTAQFRSVGLHLAPGGNFPVPVVVATSTDGGGTWTSKQVTPAGTTGHGPNLWGLSGCTIRTDSHGVVYLFSEMFENPALVGLPTHGFHVMFKSFDGGKHWTSQQIIRQITDPCYFADPVYGRCVMDGYAGARTDLAAAPSVDIANGAPTGAGATNEIVDAWADGTALNAEEARVVWSTNGGATWSSPTAIQLPGDRPIYAAPAISPQGDRMYVIYEADRDPWRGADMTSTRRYRGVLLSSPVTAGAPTAWSPACIGPDGDYGLGVWTDARDAQVCSEVQTYRAASYAGGERVTPAPWPLFSCPLFGNTDIWAATTG